MPLIYLDQNALVKLGFAAKDAAFRAKLDGLIASGFMTIVMSSWHLIETAHTDNVEMAVALADFIDSIKPMWLLERRDIQRLDVEEDFLRFAKIDFEPEPRVTTRSAVIASLNRAKDSAKYDIPSRNFVKQWIEHPEQLATLEKAYRENAEALIGLRELVKSGKLTPEIRERADRELFKQSLPKFTRAGLEIGDDTKKQYLEQATVCCVPSLSIETAISEHEWVVQGGADRNTLIDKMHLIAALPYTCEIVSNDKLFGRLHPIAAKTGHVRAQLLSNEEFLKRLVP